MENVERIEYMENILNEGKAAVSALRQALDDYAALAPRLSELFDYYGSELWFADLAADEAGLLPQELRRGVLSEDGINSLMENYRELQEELAGFAQL